LTTHRSPTLALLIGLLVCLAILVAVAVFVRYRATPENTAPPRIAVRVSAVPEPEWMNKLTGATG